MTSLAEQAWAAGWASADTETYVHPDRAAQAARRAAIGLTAPLRWVAETAERHATRLALHRARLRLYHRHARPVVAAFAPAVAAVNIDRLVLGMLAAGPHRPARRDVAAAALANAALPHRPRIDTANQTAWVAAVARGNAEAAATPPAGGPPNPRHVAAALAGTTIAAAAVAPHGAEWTDRQISRLAWAVSAGTLLEHPTPEIVVADTLTTGDVVDDATTDSMHDALTGAFSDYFTTGDGATLGALAWITEEDERVCPACEMNAENGPYLPLDLPDCPAHPLCRCSIELA